MASCGGTNTLPRNVFPDQTSRASSRSTISRGYRVQFKIPSNIPCSRSRTTCPGNPSQLAPSRRIRVFFAGAAKLTPRRRKSRASCEQDGKSPPISQTAPETRAVVAPSRLSPEMLAYENVMALHFGPSERPPRDSHGRNQQRRWVRMQNVLAKIKNGPP